MSELQQLNSDLDVLTSVRRQRQRLTKELDKLKEREDKLREQIMFGMHQHGLKSLRNDHLSASIAQRPRITITNPSEVIIWLETNHYDANEYLRLDARMVESLALGKLKSSGELVEGTSVERIEYVSVKEAKKEKDQ